MSNSETTADGVSLAEYVGAHTSG